MSRAVGQVYKNGGLSGYWLYNGTVDVAARPEIVQTREDAWGILYAAYRSGDPPWPQCQHPEASHAPVILYAEYGSGSHWPGKICETCRLIVDGLSPDSAEWEKSGRPEFTLKAASKGE